MTELPPPAAPAYSQQPPPPPARTSGLAIAGLVVSGLGLVCCPYIGPLLGLIFGIVSISSINGSQGRLTGKGMAVTATLLGVLGLLLHGGATIGLVVVGQKIEQQIIRIQDAAKNRDWGKVAQEVMGPGSISKDEVVKKMKEAEAKYGEMSAFELAQQNPDPNGDPWSQTWIVNFDGTKGSGNAVLGVKFSNLKFLVKSLEFHDGHVPKTFKH
jgi:hypothetical protein